MDLTSRIFAALRERLVVEVDGDQHAQVDAEHNDALRTAFLNQLGYPVIRFSNHQVTSEFDAVLDAIYAALLNP